MTLYLRSSFSMMDPQGSQLYTQCFLELAGGGRGGGGGGGGGRDGGGGVREGTLTATKLSSIQSRGTKRRIMMKTKITTTKTTTTTTTTKTTTTTTTTTKNSNSSKALSIYHP